MVHKTYEYRLNHDISTVHRGNEMKNNTFHGAKNYVQLPADHKLYVILLTVIKYTRNWIFP